MTHVPGSGDLSPTSRNAQLGRNVASMYVPRILAAATTFFLFPFIAHHIGLQDYGTWLVISSTTMFFLLDFGMSSAVTRYVAQAEAKDDTETINRVVSTSLVFFGLLGVILGVFFLVTMTLLLPTLNIPEENRTLAFSLVCLVVVNHFLIGMPLSVFRNAIAGVHRYDVTNLLLVGQLTIRASLIVLFVLGGAGIMVVALVEAVAATVMAVGGVLFAYKLIPGLNVSVSAASWTLLKSMAPYSAQVFVIGISSLVILQTDNLIVGSFLSVAMVTIYAAAFRLYSVCRELTASAMRALVPDASRARALGEDRRLRHFLLRGTKYSNALVLIVGVPTMVFAEPMLVTWAGPQFAEATLVTQVLIASLIVNNNHLIAASLLTGMGRIGAFAAFHVIWAVANVVLSVVLVGRVGLVGVALGTAIPIICLEPLYIRTALRELDVSAKAFLSQAVGKTLLPGTAAATPLAIAVWTLSPQGFWAAVALSAMYVVAFLTIFAIVGLDDEERSRAMSAIRRFKAIRTMRPTLARVTR